MTNYLAQKIADYITVLVHQGLSPKAILEKMDNIELFIKHLNQNNQLTFDQYEQTNLEIDAIKARFHREEKNKSRLTRLTDYFQIRDRVLLNRYSGMLMLIILALLLSFGLFRQFFKKPNNTQAYSSGEAIYGSRILSFQGRLTDSISNPITTATKAQYRLYNTESGGSSLYDSGSCTVVPDQDGIFSVLIGKDCGTEIPNSVFTENQYVYLGVTAGTDSEMKPRQQIANVAYAINAETLQGLPRGTSNSSVPYINAQGEIIFSSNTPSLRSISTSATFNLSSANGMVISTSGTGDLTLQATESGNINLKTGTSSRLYVQNNGNIGIGTTTPSSLLSIGSSSPFQVDSNGNLVKIYNVSYSFPSSQGF